MGSFIWITLRILLIVFGTHTVCCQVIVQGSPLSSLSSDPSIASLSSSPGGSVLAIRFQRPGPSSAAALLGGGPNGMSLGGGGPGFHHAGMMMGSSAYPSSMMSPMSSMPGSFGGFQHPRMGGMSGMPGGRMIIAAPGGPLQEGGFPSSAMAMRGMSPMAYDGFQQGGPGNFMSMKGNFPSPTEMRGAYPGFGQRPVMMGDGPFQGPAIGMGMGADVSGVSFLPFARIRPGPGLMIVTKDMEEPSNATGSVSEVENEPAAFPFPWENQETSTATFPVAQSLETSTATFPAVPAATSTTGIQTSTPTFPAASAATSTVTSKPTTTGASTTTTASTGPCKSPVYMSRNFMSTALQLGLISKNTTCLVIVDQ